MANLRQKTPEAPDHQKRFDQQQVYVSAAAGDPQQPNLSLSDAVARTQSAARAQFTAAVHEESATPIELAMLLACEERTADDPAIVVQEVNSQIEELVEATRMRLSLASWLGEDRTDPRAVVSSASSTLFGTGSAEDDTAFFAGNDPNYYDPRNSLVDVVLQRKLGIPITLSLVYAEICKRLGCSMVGLNAPGHLLIAPADKELPFVVDPFNGGALLSLEDAALMIAGYQGISVEQGKIMLQMLRNRPMTGHMWCARMLRNLRAIYAQANDLVRTLSVAERLRIVGQARPEASTQAEQLECAVQIVYCIFTLRWEARRSEAKTLLAEVLKDDGLSQVARQQLSGLLQDDWFQSD